MRNTSPTNYEACPSALRRDARTSWVNHERLLPSSLLVLSLLDEYDPYQPTVVESSFVYFAAVVGPVRSIRQTDLPAHSQLRRRQMRSARKIGQPFGQTLSMADAWFCGKVILQTRDYDR